MIRRRPWKHAETEAVCGLGPLKHPSVQFSAFVGDTYLSTCHEALMVQWRDGQQMTTTKTTVSFFLFILNLVKPFWRASIFTNGRGTTQLAMKKWILYNKSTIINHTNDLNIIYYLMLHVSLIFLPWSSCWKHLVPWCFTKVPHGQGVRKLAVRCGWSFGVRSQKIGKWW